MAERPARRPRRPYSAQIVRTERLTPHMQRVVLGGDGLAGFAPDTCTDHYVKLLFPPEGVTYPEPFDLERIREELPREQWPVTRTYTVRHWDPVHRELTLDFVIHGDEGLAGPWAVSVEPGETVRFMGPGGAYAPDPTADWHLLVGDESALPAIARSLEALPRGARVHAFVEIAGPEEEQKIDSDVAVVWLHRGDRPLGEALVEAVRGLAFPEGRVHAFVHGEAHFVKELRRLLRVERQIPREDLSISGYWRQGHDEDGWQASKREWNARIEAEETAKAAS
ncbi:siderophore-interacting protein [Streptomyces sp. TRM68367]|uniref:siderophore-interacting protein n=1 Tax=Streptomyces sp. TRM68367 TaxID=2758415 RepID=UPI00165BA1C1|nr:siderophore-interacting protein [Streptomyces sp. TRM68367]MBC9730760.1 siderophore-interacting protein [Streptomyces sp. TRM68367]